MSVPFEMPYIYACEGIPPRKRTPRKFHACSMAVFTIPEANPDELQPALVFRRHAEKDGKACDTALDINQCRGMLVRPLDSNLRRWDDTPLTRANLAGLSERWPNHLPKALWADSSRYAYEYPGDVEEASVLNPAKITRDYSRETRDEIQRKIDDNLVIVGDVVYARAPDPCWDVFIWGRDGGWTAQALLTPSRTFSFPGDCRDALDSFSDWCLERFGHSIQIDPETWIEAAATEIPFSGNPVVRAAQTLADIAQLNIVNTETYGPETKRLGLSFRENPSPSSAVAFISAFEKGATAPDAYPMRGTLENREWFEMFWKFYELMPEGYKLDPGMEALDGFDEETAAPSP